MRTIRIFISSPGDVSQERERARAVLTHLQKRYGDQVILQPLLWEDLPIQPDASFQEAIDAILSHHGVDIAVFILWSRLGSELATITKPDGSTYRSGTEREFDLMMAARQQSPDDQKLPHLLVYTRQDQDSFASQLNAHKSSDALKDLIDQRRLVEDFIQENFHDEKGRNLRAYHSFPKPIDFASRLKAHLTALLDEMLVSERVAATWDKNPYVGLHAFQSDQAAIFFGRETETDELASLLRSRERDPRDGTAFACVVGSSGSGKSSLVRAGLAPELINFSADLDDSSDEWTFLPLTPTDLGQTPWQGLVTQLASVFPALTAHADSADLASILEKTPDAFIKLSLLPAITAAESEKGSPQKLLILIDQFEECFTLPLWKGKPAHTTHLVELLQLLARSGKVWVVATLRADFYPFAQSTPGFLDLRGPRNFDLLPPDSAALRRIITQPASLAGVSFEVTDPKTGATLADRLLTEIDHQSGALPLLQFTLEDLFERSTGSILTLADYQALGGLSGAVQTRAEDLFSTLSQQHSTEDLEKVFPSLFSKLFTIAVSSGKETAVRRTATQDELLTDSPNEEITRAWLSSLTSSRLLTAGESEGTTTYTVAHEALLHGWPRLIQLREQEAENLRRRARLEPAEKRYSSAKDNSLLLAEGLPLNEGQQVLTESPHLLTPSLKAFITDSTTHHKKRRTRRRRLIIFTISILTGLTVITLFAAEQRKLAIQRAITSEGRALQTADNLLKKNEIHKTLLIESSNFDYSRAQTLVDRDGRYNESLAYFANSLKSHPENKRSYRKLFSLISQHSKQYSKFIRFCDTLVSHAKISNSGKTVAISTAQGEVYIFDTTTGKQLSAPLRHQDDNDSININVKLAFSHDDSLLATAGSQGTIKIWSTKNWREKRETSIPSIPHNGLIEFDTNGENLIISNSPGDLRIWRLSDDDDSEKITPIRGNFSREFRILTKRDGIIMTHDEDSIYEISISNGSITHKVNEFKGDERTLKISPQGNYVFVSQDSRSNSSAEGLLFKISDPPEKKTMIPINETQTIVSATFSQDESLVAITKDMTLEIWNTQTRKKIGSTIKHSSWISNVSFTNNNQHIISSGKVTFVHRVADTRLISTIVGCGGSAFDISQDQKFWVESATYNAITICKPSPLPENLLLSEYESKTLSTIAKILSSSEFDTSGQLIEMTSKTRDNLLEDFRVRKESDEILSPPF